MHAHSHSPTSGATVPPYAAQASFEAATLHAMEQLAGALSEVRGHAVPSLEHRLSALERALGELRDELGRATRRLAAAQEQDRTRHGLARASRMSRKERVVVFVGRETFGDNIKYAYLECLARSRELDFECWYLPFDAHQHALIESIGGRSFPHDPADWSREHVGTAMRAAVAVFCDHFLAYQHPHPLARALLAGARTVQLWHGLSIKEIALRNPAPLAFMDSHQADVLASCGRFDVFVGASPASEPDWRRWFAFERYAPLGGPRTDPLLRDLRPRDLLNVDGDALDAARRLRAGGRRVLLYAPTFRDAQPGRWILEVGLERMAAQAAARGDFLLVNLHPYESAALPQLQQRLPGVCFVLPRTDIYPLLREVSVLISDYSSLMFDFLPMDRPIVLFRPDHERYSTQSRALIDSHVEYVPGPVAESVDVLDALLRSSGPPSEDLHAPVRRALLARLCDRVDGYASGRVAELIAAEVRTAVGGPRTATAPPESPSGSI